MSYTLEDFRRDFIKEQLQKLTPQERQEALKGLSSEERLEGLSLEERLKGHSPEEIERVLQKLKGERPSGPRKTHRKKK